MIPTLLAFATVLLSAEPRAPSLPHGRVAETLVANDSRRSAGILKNGVLDVYLEARVGTWYPEGEHGVGVETAGWAEIGKPLENPGPAIRTHVGTVVRMSIHNALAKPLTVFGFGKTRGASDSIIVAVGATREVEFTAGMPGTCWYAGRTIEGPIQGRFAEDSQLNGAIIVDPAGAKASTDRVFMISWNFISGPYPPRLLNGSEHPAPLEFQAGKRYRLRVIGITGDLPSELTLTDGATPVEWRAIARDVMDLPPSPATTRPAHLILDPGQIYDFEFAPATPGIRTLQYGIAPAVALPGYKQATVEVRVRP